MTLPYPPSKTTPWSHQIKAWELASQHRAFYLAVDMGGGKSKILIDYANGFDCKKVLILCPKSVVDVWPYQFDMHSFNDYLYIGHDFAKTWSVEKKVKYIGQRMAMAAALQKHFVLILNYESIFRPPLGPVRKNKRIINPGLLLSQDWDLIGADEAHRIKAPGGEASWMAKKLHFKAKRRLALSGTPLPHGPEDAYAQFRFLNPDIFGTNYTFFRANYCQMGGFENRQIIQYVNMDDFTKKFYSIAYRVKTRDVVDLPEEIHTSRYCDLGNKIRKVYDAFESELIAEFEGGMISADNALVKLLRLAQMTAGYVKGDDGVEQTIDTAKFDLTEDIISDIDHAEPLVIMYRFTNEMFALKAICKKLGRNPGVLRGGENDLKAFQDGSFDTLLVQSKSGNAGIDLTRARYCIYFSKFALGEYAQSIARTMRPGQKFNVNYIHIIARNTVDQRIMNNLATRQHLVDKALLDNDAEAQKALMLLDKTTVAELLGIAEPTQLAA